MTIYKIYINLYIDNSTIKHKKEMDIMKKLFLSLLLATIITTSIKPAEQAQSGNSWVRARCLSAAGLLGLSQYPTENDLKEKQQRLRGHIVGPATPEEIPQVPGVLPLLSEDNIWVKSFITGSIIGIAFHSYLYFGNSDYGLSLENSDAYNWLRTNNEKSFGISRASRAIMVNFGLTLTSFLLLDHLNNKRKKQNDDFTYEYIKANPDSYKEQWRLNFAGQDFEEYPIMRKVRTEIEAERQAAYKQALAERNREANNSYTEHLQGITAVAGIIDGYLDNQAVPALWQKDQPIP